MLPPRTRLLLLLASLGAVRVDATPTISFPINSQVPPVARISQPFSYVFPSETFTSSSGSLLSYALKDPPSWLSIDSDSRRLYGTPRDADIAPGSVVGVPITLVASDSTGSTPLSVTLVVSRNPGPTVHVPVSDQIQKFGIYSEPSSILLYPDRNFLFAFAPDTFIDSQAQTLNYYAVTTDNSPLPAWVSFDAGTLAFAGTTPPFASLIEPPQTFSLKLIASDVTGFSAASITFSIVVGSHALTTSQPRITLNATVGTPLSYTGLIGSVKIDGQPAAISDVPRATAVNLPSWLVFDPTSWAIAGTPPDTAQSTSFSVIMEDDFSDKLNITFDIELAAENGDVFQGIFPTLSLEPGDRLSFDLKPFVFDPSESEITTDVQPPTPWIEFDASNLLLSGDVPTSSPSSVIEVVFNVKAENPRLKRDEMLQSQKLTIQILSTSEPTTVSPESSTSSASSAATSSNASATPGDQSAHNGTTNVVLVAILVPVILGLLFAICFCFCCYRRRQRRLSRTPLEGKDSCGPEPTSYIHTQGYDPEASRLDLSEQQFVGLTNSQAEKSKPRKPSNLRSEYTGSPVPEAPAPALPIIVHDAPTQDALPSKYRDLMAPLRNFRIPRLKRGNTRYSNDSFDEDDGRGFSLDHPPSITLRQSRQNSFRSEVEVSIPSLDSERSPLQTPDVAYTGSTARPGRDGGHHYPFPATPMDRGPPPRNPARVHSDLGSRDITPVDQSEIIIEKTRPAADEPKIREHPALRHAKSQRSFLSFSSVDTFRGTRRLAGKATASAKGAASLASAAVQRKTLKAWGKVRLHVQDSPHARQGIFDNVAHGRTEFGRFGHFGGSVGYMSLRDPGVPATVPTPRMATAPVALNSESHRRRQSRMNGSISSDSRSSRAMSVGAGENRLSRSDPGTVRRRRGSGSYDMPQFPTTSPRGSYMGLGISDYEGLVNSSPFHPSRDRGRTAVRPTTTSWATTQARFSSASSMDRPVTAKTAQTAQTFSSIRDSRNWVVHQESPMESPMENRLESPVLPLPISGSPQGGNVSTASDLTPTRKPAERWTSASSGQGGGVSGGGATSSGNEIKRKSVAQSGKSGTSKESDGPPAFI
ncbi:polarity establishment/cellular polarization [Diaporthe eres]|uniref:Polarity establishment/cellular polarization n=1 Tax=Diaporthe eres TaxID=83184 RepID=A0ABR1NUY0_DIAER